MKEERVAVLDNVAETSLITLYVRAKETQSKNPILRDEKAVMMVQSIDYDFKRLAKKLHGHDYVMISLRVKRFDEYVHDFLARHPDGVVVSIGCGLDDRFSRIDNQQVMFYDLDLPEVIAVRRQLLSESERNQFIASSALESAWMDELQTHQPKHFLFIAEGVFPYFFESEVKILLQQLSERFPGAEMAFDVSSSFMVKRMSRHGGLKQTTASIHWGIRRSSEIEGLCPGPKFLDDWYYFDKWEKRFGFFNLLGKLSLIKNMMRIVHYQLSRNDTDALPT